MNIRDLPEKKIDAIIDTALAEDLGRGDITSEVLIPCGLEGKAFMLVKEAGVLAGSNIAEKTLHKVDPGLKVEILIQDGSKVKSGDIVMLVAGNMRSMLKAERVADRKSVVWERV